MTRLTLRGPETVIVDTESSDERRVRENAVRLNGFRPLVLLVSSITVHSKWWQDISWSFKSDRGEILSQDQSRYRNRLALSQEANTP